MSLFRDSKSARKAASATDGRQYSSTPRMRTTVAILKGGRMTKR